MREILGDLQNLKDLKVELEVFLRMNKMTLKEFCSKYNFEIYYLEKVINGLIRPSQYFIQKVLEKCK